MGTWEEVPALQNQYVVNPQWVYAKKQDVLGKLLCHKAQLVAQGLTLVYGVNYNDTYSPVAQY